MSDQMHSPVNRHRDDGDDRTREIVRSDMAERRIPGGLPAHPASGLPSARWTSQEVERDLLDPRQILAMLRRRWRVVVLTFLVVVIAGVIQTQLSPRIYMATSKLLMNTGGAEGGSPDLPALAPLLEGRQKRSVQTQIEIIQNDAVQKEAFKLLSSSEKDALNEYSSITVEPVDETDVVAVSAMSYDPKAAAALANALCNSYIRTSQEQNVQHVKVAKEYVEGQLQTVGQMLNQARTKLKRYKEQHALFDLGTESQNLITKVSNIESELRQAQTERGSSQAQLNALRSAASRMAPSTVVPTTIERTPAVQALKAQLVKLELERIEALEEYKPGSQVVRGIEGQISAVRSRLNSEVQTQVSSWQNQPNPVRQAVAQDIAKLEGQIWALDARSNALQSAANRAKTETKKLPDIEYRLSQLTADASSLQQTWEMLNEKFQSLRISMGAKVANAQILALAPVPGGPVVPQVMRNLVMSIVLGIFLALALAALIDQLDGRLHSEEEALIAGQLPVLGYVPFIKGEEQQRLLENKVRNSRLLESYRMLRTNIKFASAHAPIRCLAVTSGLPREGKSSSSVNLAVSMAKSGKQVILVDCDLRRPSLHQIFDLSNKVGFTSLVSGTVSLAEALQPTDVPGLCVLTSGPLPLEPTELLDSPAAAACFQRLREEADLVVIDTPPVLILADAHILASLADAILLIISCQESRARDVARTRDLLAKTGTNLIGMVINKVKAGDSGYYGDFYYQDRYYGNYAVDGELEEHKELAVVNGNGKPETLGGKVIS